MGLDRDFLAMLTTWVVLERYTGQDQWGNDQYGAPENVRTVLDPAARQMGASDEHHRMEGDVAAQVEMTTDALGIQPRDRITLPSGLVVQVTATQDNSDEFGEPLYQTVTAQSAQRG